MDRWGPDLLIYLGNLHIRMSALGTAVAFAIIITLSGANNALSPRWKFTDEGREEFLFTDALSGRFISNVWPFFNFNLSSSNWCKSGGCFTQHMSSHDKDRVVKSVGIKNELLKVSQTPISINANQTILIYQEPRPEWKVFSKRSP